MAESLTRLINDVKHWRDRAEEARTMADQMIDPEAKRMMVGVAESYQRIADRAQRRLLIASEGDP